MLGSIIAIEYVAQAEAYEALAKELMIKARELRAKAGRASYNGKD